MEEFKNDMEENNSWSLSKKKEEASKQESSFDVRIPLQDNNNNPPNELYEFDNLIPLKHIDFANLKGPSRP